MIAYQDGTEMKVGDSVLIEDGSTPGVITELMESVAEQSEWNVDEPGVMIKSPPFAWCSSRCPRSKKIPLSWSNKWQVSCSPTQFARPISLADAMTI
jgi:hypothetical protein